MKRLFSIAILAGLFFLACNKKFDNGTGQAHYAALEPAYCTGSRCVALRDTLDSLNTLLFERIAEGENALIGSTPKKKIVASTSLWPIHSELSERKTPGTW